MWFLCAHSTYSIKFLLSVVYGASMLTTSVSDLLMRDGVGYKIEHTSSSTQMRLALLVMQ